jgi:hypothetical protein
MASIYYTLSAKTRRELSPEIVFKNSHCYENIAYYDYALFRINIVVQTAKKNNEDTEPNFSMSCSGNMQIYPSTFSTNKRTLYLNNSYFKDGTGIVNNDIYTIDEETLFPTGRNIYFTDTILDNITNEVMTSLTIECVKSHGNSIVKFNFAPYDADIESSVNDSLMLIYSINIELLNNGKFPVHLISTNNFQTNI